MGQGDGDVFAGGEPGAGDLDDVGRVPVPGPPRGLSALIVRVGAWGWGGVDDVGEGAAIRLVDLDADGLRAIQGERVEEVGEAGFAPRHCGPG